MPLHRNPDGTVLQIPWPPPKETGVKIITRLVGTDPVPRGQAGTIDEATGYVHVGTAYLISASSLVHRFLSDGDFRQPY